MRTSLLQVVLAVAVVGGIACEGPDAITLPVTAWTAVLTPADEVPAVTGSSAAGTATFALMTGRTDSVDYTITIQTLPGTTITAAHLHQAAAGATAVVAVDLCGAGTAPACTALGAPGVLISGRRFITATHLTQMRAFGMYVNVHTTANAGGEIRGQLRIVPTDPE